MLLVTAVFLAAACGGPTAVVRPPDQPPVGSPSPLDPSPVVPAPPASPVPDPSAPNVGDREPSPQGTPKPVKPAPAKPAVWSKVRSILDGGHCSQPVATIDQAGGLHAAVGCDTRIRYAMSTNGRTWTTTTFKRPAHRLEVAPQVAVDGSTLYVAFTRLKAVDGGCGDDGLVDLGVYYRKRTLPDGGWSQPIRIGNVGDSLQSFRVVRGMIHETFTTQGGEGGVFYGYANGKTFRSVRLPSAVSTSLRVGDDGVARIAYSTGHKLRYASVRPDGRISARTIFDGKVMEVSSVNLVLGPGNRAFVSWAAHQPQQRGCADVEVPMPKPGTYFATDAAGSWAVKRLSSRVEAASLVLDTADGTAHVVFRDGRALRHMTRSASGSWTKERVPGSTGIEQAVVRTDAATGALLVLGIRWLENDDRTSLVALTLS